MIQSNKQLIRFLFIVAVLSILVQTTKATTLNFTVKKGEEVLKPIQLSVEDRVSVKFTVAGKSESSIDFYITDPYGDVKVEYRQLGYVDYRFVCEEAGEYVLHFSNTDMIEDKLVVLNYEIQHYIFGIPQMLFLTIIIVLVCMAAVATFILLGKPR